MHYGVQSILNEEKPSWNKIEPSIFFDEAKCGPLHMLYCMVIFIYVFQHLIYPYMLYTIFQILTSNTYKISHILSHIVSKLPPMSLLTHSHVYKSIYTSEYIIKTPTPINISPYLQAKPLRYPINHYHHSAS
jgi:hypothetical protein